MSSPNFFSCSIGISRSPLTSSVLNIFTTSSPNLPPRFRIFVNLKPPRNWPTARFLMIVCLFGFLCPEPSFASILFLAKHAEHVYFRRWRISARTPPMISEPISMATSSQSGASSSASCSSKSTSESAIQSSAVVGGAGRFCVGSS